MPAVLITLVLEQYHEVPWEAHALKHDLIRVADSFLLTLVVARRMNQPPVRLVGRTVLRRFAVLDHPPLHQTGSVKAIRLAPLTENEGGESEALHGRWSIVRTFSRQLQLQA